jgi:hypothetical protein
MSHPSFPLTSLMLHCEVDLLNTLRSSLSKENSCSLAAKLVKKHNLDFDGSWIRRFTRQESEAMSHINTYAKSNIILKVEF